jgi:hypothetical protein
MRSLYGALFKYSATSQRLPLENFLTEALGDLLNRVPRTDLLKLIRGVLGSPTDGTGPAQAACDRIEGATRLEWTTQYPIDYGGVTKYPDLVLLVNRRPMIVVENKLRADLTLHLEEVGDERLVRDQLSVYGKWLARRDPSGLLLFLTHETDPPRGFLTGSTEYGVEARAVYRWRSVHRWLRSLGPTEPLVTLSRELADFIEEVGIVADEPGSIEFALMHAYHRLAYPSVEGAMKEVQQSMQRRCRKVSQSPMNVGDNGHVVWGWGYPQLEGFSDFWFVGWGVRFPGESLWYPDVVPPLPTTEVGYIVMGSDRKDLPLHRLTQGSRPLGWHWPEEEQMRPAALATRPLNEFYSAPAGFTEEFKAWLVGRFDEATKAFGAVQAGRLL